MTRIRTVADASSLQVFAYHPVFVFYEQYVIALEATLTSVGITIAGKIP